MSHTSALTPWHTLFDLVLQHPAVLLWIIVFSLPIAAWLLMRVNVGTSKLSVEADAPLRLEPRRRTRRPGRGR